MGSRSAGLFPGSLLPRLLFRLTNQGLEAEVLNAAPSRLSSLIQVSHQTTDVHVHVFNKLHARSSRRLRTRRTTGLPPLATNSETILEEGYVKNVPESYTQATEPHKVYWHGLCAGHLHAIEGERRSSDGFSSHAHNHRMIRRRIMRS